MSNLSAQFPVMNQPVIDKTGTITAPWYRLLVNLFNRTGQSSGVNVTSYQVIAAAPSIQLSSGYGCIIITGAGSVALLQPTSPLDGQVIEIIAPGITLSAPWANGTIRSKITYAVKQWWAS